MHQSFVRKQLISHFDQAVRDLGHSPSEVHQECGFEISTEGDQIPTQKVIELITAGAEITNCKHFGLICASKLEMEDFGILGQYIKTAATFSDAINEYCQHLKVNSSDVKRELTKENGIAWLSQHSASGITPSPLIIQMTVATNWKFNQFITNECWNPKFVAFTFSPPEDPEPYREFFSIPIVFDSEFDGIAFDIDDLNIPLPNSDPLVHKALKEYVKDLESNIPENLSDTVKSFIARNLDSGHHSIDHLTQYLPFERRALQRKLHQEKTSYQELLDEVRFQKAFVYLKNNDTSIAQISDSLGYKNSSAFSKAFKSKFGISPKQWQKLN